ncbi:MAG: hypothetical protein ABI186_07590 [Candidatus Elarobacter sp.]
MRIIVLVSVLALAACTPGAPPAGSGAGGNAGASLTIDVSLTGAVISATPYGASAGFTPVIATIPVGSTVRFVNVDSFAHTASAVGGATFPAVSPLGTNALNPSQDRRLSTGWSSGTLAAGASSPVLTADVAGTYLYGCFFHYGAATPMRAAIVVQ